MEKECTGHEKDAGFYPENRHGRVSHLYMYILPTTSISSDLLLTVQNTGWKVFGAFVIVVAALATAAFTLYCWLRCQRNKLA